LVLNITYIVYLRGKYTLSRTGDVLTNVTLERVLATVVAVEKQ